MCILYIICYLNFLNICLTVRHIFLFIFFLSLIILLPLIFTYYYQLCSLIFNIFGLSHTWWWYRTTPTIFILRLRVLLQFTFGDMASFFFSLFIFFFPQFQSRTHLYRFAILLLSDITAPGYFYILPLSTFYEQVFLQPIWDLSALRTRVSSIQKYKILLGR